MDKVWLARYPEGVPHEINCPPTETLVSVFTQACEKYPNRIAFSCEGETLTYQALYSAAIDFASYLQNERMLEPGDRVAIMLPNILHYPVALFGTLMAGCVAVNLNPLDKAGNLRHQLIDSKARVIVVLENFVGELAQVVEETAIEQVVISSIGAMFRPLKRMLVNFVVRYIKRMVPKWSLPGSIRFRQALSSGRKVAFKKVDVTQEHYAFVQYTGGTTGTAKGVLLTHLNMVSNLYQAKAWMDQVLDDRGEVVVTALPLYHIFSLLANCMLFISYGAELLMILNPRDINKFAKTIAKRRYTGITGVNTLFNALLQNKHFRNKSDFSRLKICLGGGMAIQKPVSDEWQKLTGLPICQAYGMTEASPAISINSLKDKFFNGSVGIPLPSTELSVRDLEGKELGLGEQGEIWVRGPQVMKGYLNRKEETAANLTKDGWFKTGDVGIIDTQGYLYLVDRVKDLIIVSGFNVYPAEIENCLRGMPGILESAVIGTPCEIKGEAIKAFIVLEKGAEVAVEQVRSYCAEKLAAYKVPSELVFSEALPKSNVGKILKNKLREN